MNAPLFTSSKPYTRWWWFSGPITESAIRSQLDWAKANGFGGVEIAWLYPLDNAQPGAAWLSPEWAQPVVFAKRYADRIGLGCDFTVGSAWPFGGFDVPAEDASLVYSGLSPQRLEKSWATPLGQDGGTILDHLNGAAVSRFMRRFAAPLADAFSTGRPPGLFCDSWEVLPEGLWARGFGEAFRERFGYDILPYMPDLDAHPDERYDYRKLISEYALREFYRPCAALCHELNAYARVQCHGAPCDILAAYALADAPETEALLFDCDFAAFAASAAALAGLPVVSAEAFTCLYGWVACPGPGPHQGEEQLADLKLIADGLFANGVNQIVWHGMPFNDNPPGGTNRFYATTHVGPDSPFADQLKAFNAYLERVSAAMRRGRAYAGVAVYLPLEDTWMQGELPADLQKPSSKYVYELQETKLPAAWRGYRPLWVSAPFLKDARYEGGRLACGQAEFHSLVVDAEWLDAAALAELLRLARQGLPVYLIRQPKQPGRAKHPHYDQQLAQLMALPNVSADVGRIVTHAPLVGGDDLPEFWCRVEDDRCTLFFAHPKTRGLRYPMAYGQSRCDDTLTLPVTIHALSRSFEVDLVFRPHQSLLLTLTRDGAPLFEDITFEPPAPRRL